jgi:transposase
MEISTIGLDLAKNVFQVHGLSATGEVVIRKTLRRSQMLLFFEKLPPCLVGAEACGTSHHWARELTKLGHEVRLMPAAYVKPYVKRGKNDAVDAEAICEAVTRKTMRFVPIKSREQQAALSLHRAQPVDQAAHATGKHDAQRACRAGHRHPGRDWEGTADGARDRRRRV